MGGLTDTGNYLDFRLWVPKMGELVIKKELEREVDTRGVDLQPMFLTFLRREFDKININCFNPQNPDKIHFRF